MSETTLEEFKRLVMVEIDRQLMLSELAEGRKGNPRLDRVTLPYMHELTQLEIASQLKALNANLRSLITILDK